MISNVLLTYCITEFHLYFRDQFSPRRGDFSKADFMHSTFSSGKRLHFAKCIFYYNSSHSTSNLKIDNTQPLFCYLNTISVRNGEISALLMYGKCFLTKTWP